MLQAGYMQPREYQDEILNVLTSNSGDGQLFSTWKNDLNKAGDYWWFQNPAQIINFPDRPLGDRVEETVLSILRRKVSVKLDDILGELFRTYPNGLTPDPKGIVSVLEKYAFRSAGNWKIKDLAIKSSTAHTEVIRQLVVIGIKAGFQVYVGKREQPEATKDGQLLRDIANCRDLSGLGAQFDPRQIDRIEMIDVVWLTTVDSSIACIFEVENSTGFTSAIVRGSNVDKRIEKFMIVPNSRESELKNITDPLFVHSFNDNNWRYSTYEDLNRLVGYSKPSILEVKNISKSL
jgi:hypothetical protein